MLCISTVENIDHDQNVNDSLSSHGIEDENKLFNTIKRFGVFGDDLYDTLQTLVTKDVATEDIQILLINVETNDTNKMKQFAQERLIDNKRFMRLFNNLS